MFSPSRRIIARVVTCAAAALMAGALTACGGSEPEEGSPTTTSPTTTSTTRTSTTTPPPAGPPPAQTAPATTGAPVAPPGGQGTEQAPADEQGPSSGTRAPDVSASPSVTAPGPGNPNQEGIGGPAGDDDSTG
jgi:hypothetical protein